MNDSVVVQNELTIMNNCVACIELHEDMVGGRCPECQDKFDTNQTVLAHTIVDEGNVIYRKQWLVDTPMPSGHDWISSSTRSKDGSIREEFTEPVVHMSDRIFDEDEDLDVPSNQVICQWCYLQCNKYVVCPNCERANA